MYVCVFQSKLIFGQTYYIGFFFNIYVDLKKNCDKLMKNPKLSEELSEKLILFEK